MSRSQCEALRVELQDANAQLEALRAEQVAAMEAATAAGAKAEAAEGAVRAEAEAAEAAAALRGELEAARQALDAAKEEAARQAEDARAAAARAAAAAAATGELREELKASKHNAEQHDLAVAAIKDKSKQFIKKLSDDKKRLEAELERARLLYAG